MIVTIFAKLIKKLSPFYLALTLKFFFQKMRNAIKFRYYVTNNIIPQFGKISLIMDNIKSMICFNLFTGG